MFYNICEVNCVLRSVMYSKEFIKFLFAYQQNEFKPEEKSVEIHFKKGRGRKAEVLLPVNNK